MQNKKNISHTHTFIKDLEYSVLKFRKNRELNIRTM